MDETLLLAVMEQAVGLDTFWPTVASHASPATLLALAGTSHAARDAAVQCAPKATLMLQLSPPPTPDTLAVLRNSGRVLPTAVAINNNSAKPNPALTANHIARFMIPHLNCAAVTSLQLGGGPWLVDTALLSAISAALPGLSKLTLPNVTTPAHLPVSAAPALGWPSLRTVSLTHMDSGDVRPAPITYLLSALGARAGGCVINLSLIAAGQEGEKTEVVIAPMLLGNQLHALRKLNLPDVDLYWGADEAGGALIRNAPALEHLQVYQLVWYDDDHGTSAVCVPWRIVEVQSLHISYCHGLPLGSRPGQQPLILRVMHSLHASVVGDGVARAQHLLSPAPGKRQVQLECTHKAYRSITNSAVNLILRALTLTTPGLSNLILDGIDSADDIKDLVDLSTTGLRITLYGGSPLTSDMLEGLRDLPLVTKLEVRSDYPRQWDRVAERLLASLPAHVTDVRLSGGPSLEVVSRMCVEVSRLPHRQAHPMRLCVPGVEGWFDAVGSALTAAGISAPGVMGVLNSKVH